VLSILAMAFNSLDTRVRKFVYLVTCAILPTVTKFCVLKMFKLSRKFKYAIKVLLCLDAVCITVYTKSYR